MGPKGKGISINTDISDIKSSLNLLLNEISDTNENEDMYKC